MPRRTSGPHHHHDLLSPIDHTPMPHIHNHKVQTGLAVHHIIHEGADSGAQMKKIRDFEASYNTMVQQVLDFIALYRLSTENIRIEMLLSEELQMIIGLAQSFCQLDHGIPCSNRTNLSIIISHLDYVLRNNPFGDHHTASLIIEHGVRYVRRHNQPDPINSRSLRDGANTVQKGHKDSFC